jgi:hypothetical protein
MLLLYIRELHSKFSPYADDNQMHRDLKIFNATFAFFELQILEWRYFFSFNYFYHILSFSRTSDINELSMLCS